MVRIELEQLRKELELEKEFEIKRGDIYWVNLGAPIGNIQGGIRPCIVVSNDIGNRHAPIVSIAPLSTQLHKMKLPTHVFISKNICGLSKDSFIMSEQIRVINKDSLGDYIGHIMNDKIDKAIRISQGVDEEIENNIKRKVDAIEFLDEFIQSWIAKGRNIEMIEDTIVERELRIKDLIFDCTKVNKDIKCYYAYSEVNFKHMNKNQRRVG